VPADQSLPSLLAIGLLASAVAANAFILAYGAIRIRPLPRQLLQLWIYENLEALTRTYLSLSFGIVAGLVGLILHQSLDTEIAEDQAVLVGAAVCAVFTLYGATQAMRILRTGAAQLRLVRRQEAKRP